MHSYQHNIKTFNNATRHLTRVERSLYRDLIELYYDTENALTSNVQKLQRLVIAQNEQEKEALNYVLDEFFELTGDVYTHSFCDEVIAAYKNNASQKAAAGKASAEARRKKAEALKAEREGALEQNSTDVEQTLNECATNQKPETRNHKPVSNKLFVCFWEAGMCKTNKKRSESVFNSILKKQSDPEAFTEQLIIDIKNRLAREQMGFAQMHPTTYLNGERWNDDLPEKQRGAHATNQQFNQQPKLSTVEQASRANAEHYAELERQEAELDAQQGHDKALGNAYP